MLLQAVEVNIASVVVGVNVPACDVVSLVGDDPELAYLDQVLFAGASLEFAFVRVLPQVTAVALRRYLAYPEEQACALLGFR